MLSIITIMVISTVDFFMKHMMFMIVHFLVFSIIERFMCSRGSLRSSIGSRRRCSSSSSSHRRSSVSISIIIIRRSSSCDLQEWIAGIESRVVYFCRFQPYLLIACQAENKANGVFRNTWTYVGHMGQFSNPPASNSGAISSCSTSAPSSKGSEASTSSLGSLIYIIN